MVTTESNGVVYIPPPVSGQPLSMHMDQGIQTMMLPRRSTLNKPDYPVTRTNEYPDQPYYPPPSSYMNYNTHYTNQAYEQVEEPLPTNNQYTSSFQKSPQSRPAPPKPPRLINEPQGFKKLSRSDRQPSWLATVQFSTANEIPTSLDKRVKLLSVVK